MAQSRSTATEAQEERILEALRPAANGKTADELRALGCIQAPSRIFGLRKRGFVIRTELWDGVGADGYWHLRQARYFLVSEPLLDGKQPRKREGVDTEATA